MTLIYGLIWGSWVVFGIATVWAFAWAVRSGQFRQVSKGSKVLFDEDEPVGEMTDAFPDVPDDQLPGSDSEGNDG